MFYRTLALAFALSLGTSTLVGCGDASEGSSDPATSDQAMTDQATTDQAKASRIGDFSFVQVVVAVEDEARDLQKAMNAPTIEDGRTTLAGLTQSQLEGGDFDPATSTNDAFGLMCGKDGIGIMTCSVSAVVRNADLELRDGVMPTKVTLRGKLASAVASGLERTSPAGLVGAWSSGYAPTKIACKGTSGHDEYGPAVSCTFSKLGLGVAAKFNEGVGEGEAMSVAEADQFIDAFFPRASVSDEE